MLNKFCTLQSVALIISTLILPCAWAKDFDAAACVRLRMEFEIVGYTSVPPGALKLKENGHLSDRVWEAMDAEAGKADPTAIKSKRSDRIPQKALVKPLIDPQQAAVAQILALRGAKHDAFVGTYIFGKDPYALAMMKEVKDLLARGVNVHLLLDSEGTPGLLRHEIKMLHDLPRGNTIDDLGNATNKQAQLTTVLFNPPSNIERMVPLFAHHVGNLAKEESNARELFRKLTSRMHSKLLLIDPDYPEGIAFIGGRNKDGLYYGYEKVGPKTYNDTEVMIRNDPDEFGKGKKTLSSTVGREFRKLYGHLMNKELDGLLFGEHHPAFAKIDAKIEKASADMWVEGGDYDKILKKMQADNFLETGFDSADTLFLSEIENINRHDIWEKTTENVTPDQTGLKNLISITKELNHVAKSVNGDITIVTPYPNFTPSERKVLIDNMLDDPRRKFTMVTNSLYSGDNLITQYVVDNVLVPTFLKEAKEAALAKGMSADEATAFVDRFQIWALGKMDGVEFGGDKYYGKLHAKYAVFKPLDGDPEKVQTFVGSYNGDNISREHNAEVAVKVAGQGVTSKAFDEKTQQLISMSTRWGSPEWLEVRNSKLLEKKRFLEKIVKRVEKYIDPIE